MKPTRRRSLLSLLGISAVAAAALPVVATTVTGAPNLPDLVSESPDSPFTATHADGRLLLRFDGYITNDAAAASPLEIRATAFTGDWVATSVKQFVGNQGNPGGGGSEVGSPSAVGPQVLFENADGHNHFHLKYAAEYSLWNQDRTAQVALAQKTEAGFCLEDSMRQDGSPTPDGWVGYSAGANNFCWVGRNTGAGGPAQQSDTLVMGISPGFKDLYHANLSYQWVDISNVQPGNYQLAARVDPNNVIAESNEGNNGHRFLPYTVQGYTAKPVTAPQTGAARTVTLAADAFTNGESSLGQRRFVIRSLPKHGTLNMPVGAQFAGSTVQYTPKPGYLGSDSFTYSAVTSGFSYPRAPAEATATLAGNTVVVGLSGAPPSMVVGTSVQLSATVAGAPGGVTWSASGGSITPAGLFTAPAAPGTVTVTATSVENPEAAAQAVVMVTSQPGGPAAIKVNMAAGNRLLSPLKIGRKGARTIVPRVVTGARPGKVTFTTTSGRKVLRRCVVKAKPRTAVSCAYTVPRRYALKKIRVTAKLVASGGKTAIRRQAVIR
jgi:hypothetical protein